MNVRVVRDRFGQLNVVARSLIFRRNSAQINRSEGNLCNQSYQFAAMATQTQLMCV